jgi:hypothetical protein
VEFGTGKGWRGVTEEPGITESVSRGTSSSEVGTPVQGRTSASWSMKIEEGRLDDWERTETSLPRLIEDEVLALEVDGGCFVEVRAKLLYKRYSSILEGNGILVRLHIISYQIHVFFLQWRSL